jgi:hypothetical protein
LPITLAEPIVVPPDVHEAGGDGCGPNTLNMTVPIGAEPSASVAASDEGAIALPAVPLDGPVADKLGAAGAALQI